MSEMVSLSFSLSHFLTLSSHSQSLLFNHWVGLTSVGGSLASRQSQLLPAGMSLKIAATVWVAVSPPLPSHSLVFLPSAESVGAESPEAPTMVPCQPAPRAVPGAGDRPLQAGTTLYAKIPQYPCFRRCQQVIPNAKTQKW